MTTILEPRQLHLVGDELQPEATRVYAPTSLHHEGDPHPALERRDEGLTAHKDGSLMSGSREPIAPCAHAHLSNGQVTITLTPEQVRAAAHEVGESGIYLDGSLFSVDVHTPRAIAQARAALDEIERKMTALHWGHAVKPIEVTASPEWLSELAAGLLYELQCAPDTGLARVSGEDLRGAVDCMRDAGVQAGAVIVEQLTAKDALVEVTPAKDCRGRAPHNRIQWFRESKGMSRRDVAHIVDPRGKGRDVESDVERWEAGERPSESYLGVLARFFGVSAVYLAGEEEDKS